MNKPDQHNTEKPSQEEHIQLAIWAANCAEGVLSIFEANCDDDRPRKAIEAARAWARGELKMTAARKFAFAAHAAARMASTPTAIAAARAAGHAAATAHVASHAKYAAAYAQKAMLTPIKTTMAPILNLQTITDQMVTIPKGTITLRDDRLKQIWTVELQPFLMAKYPVTQELYDEVVQENPSTFKGKDRPVETVLWIEAITFCNLLSQQLALNPCYLLNEETEEISFDPTANGYRLPTEAEWEYACKAGTTEIRYGELDEIAWYKENAGRATHPIGMKKPNAWGLYDMLGNVWEWCTDIYDEQVYGSYRIFRGGGWCDEPRACMATNRRRSHPTKFKIDDLGFRLARNIK